MLIWKPSDKKSHDNDVINKDNKTKQIIDHSKGSYKSYQKNVLFVKFKPLCQKLFMSNFGLFYHAHSQNIQMLKISNLNLILH